MKEKIEKTYIITFKELKEKFDIPEKIWSVAPYFVDRPTLGFDECNGIEVSIK